MKMEECGPLKPPVLTSGHPYSKASLPGARQAQSAKSKSSFMAGEVTRELIRGIIHSEGCGGFLEKKVHCLRSSFNKLESHSIRASRRGFALGCNEKIELWSGICVSFYSMVCEESELTHLSFSTHRASDFRDSTHTWPQKS
jgi:hypothetical protein